MSPRDRPQPNLDAAVVTKVTPRTFSYVTTQTVTLESEVDGIRLIVWRREAEPGFWVAIARLLLTGEEAQALASKLALLAGPTDA